MTAVSREIDAQRSLSEFVKIHDRGGTAFACSESCRPWQAPLPLFALEGDDYEAFVLGTSMGETSGGCQTGVAKYLS